MSARKQMIIDAIYAAKESRYHGMVKVQSLWDWIAERDQTLAKLRAQL